MEPQDSNFVLFAKRLEYVPRYVFDYFFGLLAAIVSDVVISTIALATVALGLATGQWLLAVAFFFTLYAVLRIVSILANAIGSSGQLIAQSMRQPQPQPTIFQGGNQMPPPAPAHIHPDADPPVQGEVLDGNRIAVTLPSA